MKYSWIAIVLILLLIILVPARPAAAQAIQIQVFGEYHYGIFIGVDAYVTMSAGTATPEKWIAAPTGFKNRIQTRFIESGPSRYLASDGRIHPYASAQDKNGFLNFFVDTGSNLASGGQYRYYSKRVSGTTFQAVFCSGSGCKQLLTMDAGVTALGVLVSGGEALNASSHWGTITTKYNIYTNTSNVRVPWCWNSAQSTGTTNKPSACFNSGNGQINAWTIKY